MSYLETISKFGKDAEQLEELYRTAMEAGETAAFKAAIDENHTHAPDNLLYAAWFYRLKYTAERARDFAVAWAWVIPLALINGLLFWWLSDYEKYTITLNGIGQLNDYEFLPTIIMLAAPISAAFVLIYLTAAGHKSWRLAVPLMVVMAVAGAYVLLTFPQVGTRPFQEQYLTLMAMHLPLLAWAGVGIFLLFNYRDPANRFAFLIKSFEIFIMGGLFVAAGGLFTVISVGLFEALGVDFSELVLRLFIAGGGGLIPVVAVAVMYNPARPPAKQSFDEGLGKLVALLLRFMLPLTLLLLVVYIAFIPFNFREPFENRDVLIIYNGMLFAVIALLVGATPVSTADLSPRLAYWLRLGIVAVAALALFVSLYALAAILYRTIQDRLTPNRLAFIGWNLINIALLFLLLLFQLRERGQQWLHELFRAYSIGTAAYVVWTVVVIAAVPWLFGINKSQIEGLPEEVQEIIYQFPEPLLLKCASSPHVYLLDRGEKRWIEDIPTFNEQGYLWRDVHTVSCENLRSIPNGQPIPSDAGPPPEP
ncbi:MAG: hypothetical protein WAM60_16740 [Candidatus Promineifilaceae bacterium]